MKTVFAALNASYIHTSLAIRSVSAYAGLCGIPGIPDILDIRLWERTINHRYRYLLGDLASLEADVVVFSLYIWNVEIMKLLATDLRKIHPGVVLIAAGPEAGFHCRAFLEANPAFDYVLAGEGEVSTVDLLRALAETPAEERRRLGSSGLSAFGRHTTGEPPAALPDLDKLPFPYQDLTELKGRILYYESMRGCPFRCAYCLSSVGGEQPGRVRYRSLDLVFADLTRFLEAGAGQVKFVDRTFNCDKKRARAIWTWLAEHDNGVTGFHFELAGELLDEDCLRTLAGLRPGLVQLEIGVQSANPKTLATIRRSDRLADVFANVARLRAGRNIHLHLDLIAGLPFEDYESFARSFDTVYRQRPDQLQLGFLKVLKGSPLEAEAEEHDIRYQTAAPYEVLSTRWLSFPELRRLQSIADMVDLYYNSGRFSHLLGRMIGLFDSPFAFFERLADFYRTDGHDERSPGKIGYYEILGGFLTHLGVPLSEEWQWLCRYDLALHEKPKKIPAWVAVDGSVPHRERILRFWADPSHVEALLPACRGKDPRYILKVSHVEVFPLHPDTLEPGETALLFDYSRRDVDGRAVTTGISLEKNHKI